MGQWHNPPAEVDVSATYGISYRLRLDSEINWIEHRNRQFLRSYRDGSYPVSEASQNRPYREGCNDTRYHHYSTTFSPSSRQVPMISMP